MYQSPYGRRRRSGGFRFLLLIIFLGGLGYLGWNYLDRPSTFTAVTDRIKAAVDPAPQPIDRAVLGAKLAPYLKTYADNNWKVGLAVLDFKTGSTYLLNQDDPFTGASLDKVPV